MCLSYLFYQWKASNSDKKIALIFIRRDKTITCPQCCLSASLTYLHWPLYQQRPLLTLSLVVCGKRQSDKVLVEFVFLPLKVKFIGYLNCLVFSWVFKKIYWVTQLCFLYCIYNINYFNLVSIHSYVIENKLGIPENIWVNMFHWEVLIKFHYNEHNLHIVFNCRWTLFNSSKLDKYILSKISILNNVKRTKQR